MYPTPRLYLIIALLISIFNVDPEYSLVYGKRNSNNDYTYEVTERGYPLRVPVVKIRIDSFGKPVERGRLELIGGVSRYMLSNKGNVLEKGNWSLWSNRKAVTLAKFREVLQCAPYEPDLDGRRGVLSMLKLLRVSRRTVEMACAWAEERCWPWATCRNRVEQYREGKKQVPDIIENRHIRLVRVTNGTLFMDWPWRADRIVKRAEFNVIRLFAAVLEKVRNMPDSVFFTQTYDWPLLPPNFPFPAFSHSPRGDHNFDIPFPWPRIIEEEVRYHVEQVVNKRNVFPDLNPSIDRIWTGRIEKLAFYGALWENNHPALARQVIIDIGTMRPDLIEAKFTMASPLHPYNPESDESRFDMKIPRRSKRHLPDDSHGIDFLNGTHVPGFIRTLRRSFLKQNIKKSDYIARYKYLVIIAGNTAADRLATFLAHSGAVILIQQTDYLSHFSERLKPWVHYVPIAFNGADVIEKILWLKSHDSMARQIAMNGWTFGQSYLRIEDYYCYTAAALYEISQVEKKDALKPFNPVKMDSPHLLG